MKKFIRKDNRLKLITYQKLNNNKTKIKINKDIQILKNNFIVVLDRKI
jgi:hypothetical protein